MPLFFRLIFGFIAAFLIGSFGGLSWGKAVLAGCMGALIYATFGADEKPYDPGVAPDPDRDIDWSQRP